MKVRGGRRRHGQRLVQRQARVELALSFDWSALAEALRQFGQAATDAFRQIVEAFAPAPRREDFVLTSPSPHRGIDTGPHAATPDAVVIDEVFGRYLAGGDRASGDLRIHSDPSL